MGWYGIAWNELTWHCTAWRIMGWHNTASHEMARRGICMAFAWHGMTTWYGTAWHGTT
jgi:hypothetical protein